MRWVQMVMVVGVFGGAGLLAGCSEMMAREKKPRFTKAEVKVIRARDRTLIQRTVAVNNTDQAGQLAKFFPELGTGRKSDVAAAWKAAVIIRLTSDDGTVYRVATNYEDWNATGQGDWPLKDPDGLEKLVNKLLEKK